MAKTSADRIPLSPQPWEELPPPPCRATHCLEDIQGFDPQLGRPRHPCQKFGANRRSSHLGVN